MTKAPNRWLAALFSLFISGAGQLYAGDLKRAAAFFGVLMIAVPVGWYGVVLISGLSGLLFNATLMLGVSFTAAISAWRIASRWIPGTPRATWSRWFVVLPLVLIAAVCYARVNGIRKEQLVEAYSVPSGSMEPTVLAGDDIIVDKRREARTPVRGAVVGHQSVGDAGLTVLRRVVALAHDTIEMRRGTLWLNGTRVNEPYLAPAGAPSGADSGLQREMRRWQLPHLVRDSAGYLPTVVDWGPLVVPADSFFALGDNRDDSYDSRYYGFVPDSRILGRARYIYWSRAPTGAIRWGRVGKSVN